MAPSSPTGPPPRTGHESFFHARKALLDLFELCDSFFGDRQWFDQHGDFTERAGHRIEVAFLFDHELGHIAVELIDASFREFAGVAKNPGDRRGRRCRRDWRKGGGQWGQPGRRALIA
jgi:hypothetical protein